MDVLARYLHHLEEAGGDLLQLDTSTRQRLERRWRAVYASRLHEATGQWKWKNYDWHVFSYEYAQALSGDAAIAAYSSVETSALIVIPEQYSCPSLPACRIRAGKAPNFRHSAFDVMVWPERLDWTMAFTHEEGWCGPYFSRSGWLVPDA